MNKKSLILWSSLVLVIILTGSLIWYFTKNIPIENNSIKTQASSSNLVENNNQNVVNNVPVTIPVDLVNKVIDIKAVNQEFINQVPAVTNQQIDSFSKIVATGDMDKCSTLGKETDLCKYYYSLYSKNDSACDDISSEELKMICYKKLVFINIQTKFEKCSKETILDLKLNCLNNLFWAIKNIDFCEMFSNDFIRQDCIDSTIFKVAVNSKKNNCADIKNVDIKELCGQYFLPGDFDKDGLIDAEELKIGTNPYLSDTDGDGVSDKEEIAKNTNPCGSGKLPSPSILLEMCIKLKK